MGKWAEEIDSIINNKLETAKEKDIRFFRVEEFKRNIARIDSFSPKCLFCKEQKIDVQEIVDKIDDAINVPGQSRRLYDRLISRLATHMQKKHGFYAPYYFTYLFSFFGMIAGATLGFLLLKINPEFKWALFSLGFSIGLITGYVWGALKDKKIRFAKKIM